MILPITQGRRFSELFDLATAYAHRRLRVVSDDEFFSSDDPLHWIAERAQRETCEELWKQPQILGDLARANPLNLPKNDLDILESWQHCFTSTFYVASLPGGRKGELAFTVGNQTFVVYGIAKSISSIIGKLPAIVKTTLLPFEDKITYAMFMLQYPVDLGKNMREQMESQLDSNVAAGRIVRTGAELVAIAPKIEERRIERGLEDLRYSMQMEERAAGPLEGQHKGALVGLSEKERDEAILAHMRKQDAKSGYRFAQKYIDKCCHPGEPVFSLQELVALPDEIEGYDIEDDFDPAEEEEYWASFADPQNLDDVFCFYGESQIRQFRELANKGGRWHISASDLDSSKSKVNCPMPLQGVCHYFHEGNGYVAIMPNEVVEACRDLDWDGILSYSKKRIQTLRYIEYLVELRGVVQVEEAIRLYRTAYPNGIIDADRLTDILFDALDTMQFGACMVAMSGTDTSYFVHYEVLWEHRRTLGINPTKDGSFEMAEDSEVIDWILAEQEGKEPRPLTQEMRDAESVFTWATMQPPAIAMRNYLDEHVPDEADDYFFADKVIEDLMTEVFWGTTHESIQTFFDILEQNDFHPDESQLNRLVELWTNMCNGLPCWPNNGWSPNQLAARMSGRRMFFNPDGSFMKVGRNDPCPCGSGKKFKRCCGR